MMIATAARARPTPAQLEDLLWRSLWTFVQTFVGVLIGSGLDVIDVNGLEAAALAGLGAALAVIKTYASNKLGRGTAPHGPRA